MALNTGKRRHVRSLANLWKSNKHRCRRRMALEPLEIRMVLDATGLPGNACAPNLDLSTIETQSIRAGNELVIDLLSAGGTVVDLDADENPTGDTIRFQLDPDDTPEGATITSEGVFSWTPGIDQIGTFEIVVLAIDEGSPPLADAEVFLVEVVPNAAPDLQAIPDRDAAVGEMLEVTITATDDGDNLTFLLDRDDPQSTVPDDAELDQLDNNTAVIRWTPDEADLGETFEFSVLVTDDGFPPRGDREVFLVAVTSLNANDDMYEVVVDGELMVDGENGVLANDVDSEGDPLTASVLTDPTNGSLTLAEDGSFTYMPNAEFHGTDTFTYQADDDNGHTSEATVTILVNSAPSTVDDEYMVDEDTMLTVDSASGVLFNDSDPEADDLTATLVNDVTNGTLMLESDGSFTYMPDDDFNGTDEFTYVANDGSTDSAETTVTITVNAINDAPQGEADEYTAREDMMLDIAAVDGVLANDSDVDGDDVTAVLDQDVSNGILTLNDDGSFTYMPTADFSGVDSFTYVATDGLETSDPVEVMITVVDQNAFSVAENSPAGTFVGQLTPETDLGATVVYSVDDPTLDPLLELAADDHISGNPAGSVVLIEYLDLECSVCQAYDPIVQQLKNDFPDLMVVSRHFPLTNNHPNAFDAAVAAEAAGRQGMFDEYVDLLFTNQDEWEGQSDPQPFFESYADDLGLDRTQFATDQADTDLTDRVQRDFDAVTTLLSGQLNIGTPTFFLQGAQITMNPPTMQEFSDVIQNALDAVDDTFALNRITGEITVRDPALLDFETNPSFSHTINAVGLDSSETINAMIDVTDVPE